MPYSIRKNHADCPQSKPFAVVKKSDGSKVGCHSSRDSAQRQIAAIEANENSNRKEEFKQRLFRDS